MSKEYLHLEKEFLGLIEDYIHNHEEKMYITYFLYSSLGEELFGSYYDKNETAKKLEYTNAIKNRKALLIADMKQKHNSINFFEIETTIKREFKAYEEDAKPIDLSVIKVKKRKKINIEDIEKFREQYKSITKKATYLLTGYKNRRVTRLLKKTNLAYIAHNAKKLKKLNRKMSRTKKHYKGLQTAEALIIVIEQMKKVVGEQELERKNLLTKYPFNIEELERNKDLINSKSMELDLKIEKLKVESMYYDELILSSITSNQPGILH